VVWSFSWDEGFGGEKRKGGLRKGNGWGDVSFLGMGTLGRGHVSCPGGRGVMVGGGWQWISGLLNACVRAGGQVLNYGK